VSASERSLLAQEGWREAPGWSLTDNRPQSTPADGV